MDEKENIPLQDIEKLDIKIGDLLVHENLITDDQLKLARRRHFQKCSQHEITIGNALVKLGYISKKLLNKALERCYQKEHNVGDYLVKKSLISSEKLAKALEAQKKNKNTLGEQLISLGYIAEGLLYNLLKNEVSPVELTNLLIENKKIDNAQLQKAKRVNDVGYRIGDILVNDGFVADEQLKKSLSFQYKIPFKKMENYIIIEDKKKTLSNVISLELSQSYNVIPYHIIDSKKVEIALGDINFLDEIKELEKNSLYSFFACIVKDDDFKLLYNDLYTTISAQEQVDQVMKNLDKRGGKNNEKAGLGIKKFPSEFFQAHASFIQTYFNALKNTGFTEAQAIEIVKEEAEIKYPGKPSGVKRTDNVAEFFSVIVSDPVGEEESIDRLFQNYVKAKLSCDESTSKIRKEIFEEHIISNLKKIKSIRKCNTAKCNIIIENGSAKVLIIEN